MVEGEVVKKINKNDDMLDRFSVKARLNLNDLLRSKMEEKKIDKKANLIIFSSVATIAVVVVLMLSL